MTNCIRLPEAQPASLSGRINDLPRVNLRPIPGWMPAFAARHLRHPACARSDNIGRPQRDSRQHGTDAIVSHSESSAGFGRSVSKPQA